MDCDADQTESRTALFRPVVPTLETFSPGDDSALRAVQAKTHLQHTPPEHLGQYLLPLLDDDAARRVLATGVPILSGPDIIWPALEQHPAESVDKNAACLRVLATKLYPKASEEVRGERALGHFTMKIPDPKTKKDSLLNMPTSPQPALLRASKLEACREALRQLPNELNAATKPAVFKPQPSRTPSVLY
ncbi:hypothetical protein FGIG_03249 [Fasciola gigantica]|uniref:Uncharacterized protein n=1 Tax=Fasciola gigantica TaxID=46835 RepID=A0A504Z5I1_FASGI|nr:hypothetical protein FGIG_12038 [Fasciola gigantica]TPP67661.1 hypothetical protein FGIG_03249 [Fasciola gigantica]